MEGFLLEALLFKGWRRGGEILWTLDDAKRTATAMLKRREARAVRILPVEVRAEPVTELPEVVRVDPEGPRP